jgi:2-amino-4-hydroxy-6-hydroxymethyldihydropteridine diphosphokinase
LPHGDIQKYGFVLGPLAEIAPNLRHPVAGLTMRGLWAGFDRARHPMTRVELDVSAALLLNYQPILRPPSTAMICPVI